MRRVYKDDQRFKDYLPMDDKDLTVITSGNGTFKLNSSNAMFPKLLEQIAALDKRIARNNYGEVGTTKGFNLGLSTAPVPAVSKAIAPKRRAQVVAVSDIEAANKFQHDESIPLEVRILSDLNSGMNRYQVLAKYPLIKDYQPSKVFGASSWQKVRVIK